MDHHSRVEFVGNCLDDAAKEHFRHVGDVAWYEAEASADRLAVFAVLEDGKRVASYALRVDELKETGEKEGVVVAAFGDASVDLVRTVLPKIENTFHSMGVTLMRVHTERPGLVAKIAEGRELTVTWSLKNNG